MSPCGAASVKTARSWSGFVYRYRGHNIPSPWADTGTGRTTTTPGTAVAYPASRSATACPVESRLLRDGHVRFGGRVGKRIGGNADTAPRPDPAR